MLIHLVRDKPFEDSVYNCVQIGNETIIFLSSGLLFIYTPYNYA